MIPRSELLEYAGRLRWAAEDPELVKQASAALGKAEARNERLVASTGKLRIASPLPFAARCSAACRYALAIVLSASTARRFGLGSRAVTIGTAHGA